MTRTKILILLVSALLLCAGSCGGGGDDGGGDGTTPAAVAVAAPAAAAATGGGVATAGGGTSANNTVSSGASGTVGGIIDPPSGGAGGGVGGGAAGGAAGGSSAAATGGASAAAAAGGGAATGGASAAAATGGASAAATGGGGGALTRQNLYSGLASPTAAAIIGSRVFFVTGFNLGQNFGRVFTFDVNQAVASVTLNTPPVVEVTASAGINSLTNPWDIIAVNGNLYVTQGFNSLGNGGIVELSNLTAAGPAFTADFATITQGAVPQPQNPLFMATATTGAGTFVYWTEYNGAGAPGGQVRRINVVTRVVTDILTGLDFPAGIATGGTGLVVALNGATSSRVITFPLEPASPPIAENSPLVTNLLPATGQQAILRPFDVASRGANVSFTEGFALPPQAPSGQGTGAVRFFSGTSAPRLVANGLTNVCGLHHQAGDVLFFVEAIGSSNGRLLRRDVDPANIVNVAPDQIDIGLNNPVDTIARGGGALLIENFQGGQNGGFIKIYQ